MVRDLKYTVVKSGIDPSLIGDICMGNVADANAAYATRAAALAAGIPNTTPAGTVNRFCSSGLQAIENIGESKRHWQTLRKNVTLI